MRAFPMKPLLAAVAFALASPAALAAGQEYGSTSDDDWHYRVAPYLWATGLSGDIGLGDIGPVGSIDASFSDVWDNLDIAGMVAFDARRGRWGFASDVFYAKLGRDSNAYLDAGYGKLDVEVENTIIHLAATYRLSQTDRGYLDAVGGIRWADVHTRIDIAPGTALPDGANGADSQDWIDGFVGLSGESLVADNWGLFGRFDVGAGGTDLSWQAIAGARWYLDSGNSVDFGYRYLSQDYGSNDYTYDVQMGGLFAGMSFRF